MKRVRWIAEYLLYHLITFPLKIIPRKIRLAAGSWLGYLFYLISGNHRNVTLTNLSIAFPEKDYKWRKKKAFKAYRHFGRMLVDTFTFSKLNKQNLSKYISGISGEENLKKAYNKNRGVLCIAAHYGSWELLPLAASLIGYKVTVIARLSDNPYLEGELHKARVAADGEVLHKKNAMRNMRKALNDGRVIGILIDQNQIHKEGVFVNFFSRKASTTPSFAMLAVKYDIPVIPSYCLPLSNNKYRLVFGKEIKIKKTGKFSEDVLSMTQKGTKYIENIIRENPEYWLWMHKRWKTRPDGKNNLYK